MGRAASSGTKLLAGGGASGFAVAVGQVHRRGEDHHQYSSWEQIGHLSIQFGCLPNSQLCRSASAHVSLSLVHSPPLCLPCLSLPIFLSPLYLPSLSPLLFLSLKQLYLFHSSALSLFLITSVSVSLFLSLSLSFFFLFLWQHLRHMEVPRLGVKMELQLRPTPQLQPCQIQATSENYAAACSNSESLTPEGGQGLNPHPQRDNIRFLTH